MRWQPARRGAWSHTHCKGTTSGGGGARLAGSARIYFLPIRRRLGRRWRLDARRWPRGGAQTTGVGPPPLLSGRRCFTSCNAATLPFWSGVGGGWQRRDLGGNIEAGVSVGAVPCGVCSGSPEGAAYRYEARTVELYDLENCRNECQL